MNKVSQEEDMACLPTEKRPQFFSFPVAEALPRLFFLIAAPVLASERLRMNRNFHPPPPTPGLAAYVHLRLFVGQPEIVLIRLPSL